MGRENASQKESRVLKVQSVAVKISNGYKVKQSFVGRVEAARSSDLGYEFGGLVKHLAVDEGDRVNTDELIAELDTERLQARRTELSASLNEARAALALAESTRERTRKAFDLNAVSGQQWDEAQRQFEVQQAVVQRIKAQIASIDVDLNKAQLRAPFPGTVSTRHVDEGAVVAAGQPIVRLLELARPEIRIGISNDLVERVAVGQELPVTIDGQSLTARVRAVLPDRKAATRTVNIVLTLPALTPGLQDGDLADLQIFDEIAETGLWLPLGALTESSRGLWACYVAEPLKTGTDDKRATHRLARRQLELLHQRGEQVYVRGPISDGELVVSEGLHRLVPGQRVQIQVQGDKGTG